MPARLSWQYPAGCTEVKIYRSVEEVGIIDDANLIATIASPTVQYNDSGFDLLRDGVSYSIVPQDPVTPIRNKGKRLALPTSLANDLSGIEDDDIVSALAKAALRGYWLDFANNIYWRHGTRVTSLSSVTGFAFSRASAGAFDNADGSITTASSGAFRRNSLGLVMEGAATNIIPNSTTFTAANSANIASTSIVAPTGASVATRFDNLQSSTGDKIVSSQASIAGSTAYAGAIYVRGVAGEKFSFYARNGAGDGTPATSSVVQVTFTGTWQRLKNLVFTSASDNTVANIYGIKVDGTDNAAYVEVFGAQLEAAAGSSSYVATTGTPATRAVEFMSLASPSVVYPLALFGRAKLDNNIAAAASLVTLDTGAGDNEASLRFSTTLKASLYSEDAAVASGASTVTNASAIDTFVRMAGRVKANDSRVYGDGQTGDLDSVIVEPATPTRLLVGCRHGSTGMLRGVISDLAVIPGPNGLENAVLSALSENW